MSDDDKDIDFAKWTGDEKLAAFTRLGKLLCGVAAPLDEAKGQWFVPIAEEFRPKELKTICVNPHLRCKLRRLHIFEPVIERSEIVFFDAKTTIIKRWFRKDRVLIEQRPTTQREVTRETVKRCDWAIHTIFAGQRLQLPGQATLPGDAFAGDPKFDFDGDLCEEGNMVALTVENLRPFAMPFRACLVVERAEEPKRKDGGDGGLDAFRAVG